MLPKKKKKPYPIPFKEIKQAAREDKKLAQMGIEKPLQPPKNGLLVPNLIPVAYEVLDAWKLLIKEDTLVKETIWSMISQNEPSVMPISMVITELEFFISHYPGSVLHLSEKGALQASVAIMTLHLSVLHVMRFLFAKKLFPDSMNIAIHLKT